MAYTLYDDILDNDVTPALLSVANIASRQMYRLFGLLNLDKAFQHYLSAKQLNDDAHDWQKDLTNGHATSVVTRILASYGQAYNPSEMQKLQKIFWHEVIVDVCKEINDHIIKARAAIRDFGPIDNVDFFTKLIEPQAASAEKALFEREQSLAFLTTFTDKKS